MTTHVLDVPDRQRYEVVREDTVLGFAAYQKTDQLIVFTHTEVDPRWKAKASADDSSAAPSTTSAPSAYQCCPSAPSSRAGWRGTPATPELDYRSPGSNVTD